MLPALALGADAALCDAPAHSLKTAAVAEMAGSTSTSPYVPLASQVVVVDVFFTLILTTRDTLTSFGASSHTNNQRDTHSVVRGTLFGLPHGAAGSTCVASTVARCQTLSDGGGSRGLPRPRGTGANGDGGGGDGGRGDGEGGDGGGGDGRDGHGDDRPGGAGIGDERHGEDGHGEGRHRGDGTGGSGIGDDRCGVDGIGDDRAAGTRPAETVTAGAVTVGAVTAEAVKADTCTTTTGTAVTGSTMGAAGTG